jgi:hypothetical protein
MLGFFPSSKSLEPTEDSQFLCIFVSKCVAVRATRTQSYVRLLNLQLQRQRCSRLERFLT